MTPHLHRTVCAVPIAVMVVCLAFAANARNGFGVGANGQLASAAAGLPGQNVNDVLNAHLTNGLNRDVSIAPMNPDGRGNPTPPSDSEFSKVDNAKIYDGIVKRAAITSDKNPADLAGNPGYLDTIDNSNVLNAGGTRATFGYFIKVKYDSGTTFYYFALFSFDKINAIASDGKQSPITATEFFLFGPFTPKDGTISPNPPELEYGLAVSADGTLLSEVPLGLAKVSNLKDKGGHEGESVKPGVEEAGKGCLVCHVREEDITTGITPFPWYAAPKSKPTQQAGAQGTAGPAKTPPSSQGASGTGGTDAKSKDSGVPSVPSAPTQQGTGGSSPGQAPSSAGQPNAQPAPGGQSGAPNKPKDADKKDAGKQGIDIGTTTGVATTNLASKTQDQIAHDAGLPQARGNTKDLPEVRKGKLAGTRIVTNPDDTNFYYIDVKIYDQNIEIPVGADYEVKSDGTVVIDFRNVLVPDPNRRRELQSNGKLGPQPMLQKYTPGTMVVTKDPDGTVSVTVTEKGLLVPSDDKNHIFRSATFPPPKQAATTETPKKPEAPQPAPDALKKDTTSSVIPQTTPACSVGMNCAAIPCATGQNCAQPFCQVGVDCVSPSCPPGQVCTASVCPIGENCAGSTCKDGKPCTPSFGSTCQGPGCPMDPTQVCTSSNAGPCSSTNPCQPGASCTDTTCAPGQTCEPTPCTPGLNCASTPVQPLGQITTRQQNAPTNTQPNQQAPTTSNTAISGAGQTAPNSANNAGPATGGSRVPSSELQALTNALASSIFTAATGAALSDLAGSTAPGQKATLSSIPFTLVGAGNLALPGASVALQLPNFNTATVSGSTDGQGKTVVNTGNIPSSGVIVDFYHCPNGGVVGVQHDAAAPCDGAKLVGSVPVVPGVTTGVAVGEKGVTTSIGETTFIASDSSNSSTVFINGHLAYELTDDPSNPQSYSAYVPSQNGTQTALTGVSPSAAGQNFTQLQTAYGHNPAALVQGPTHAVPMPAPKPVAQPTPAAPGSYPKPPRRSARAKCPECQQYADEFNRIAGYLDDDWTKKVRLQKGIDITRQAIADRQKQIAVLQQQQSQNPQPGVQQEIDDLQKVNAGQEQGIRDDLLKLQDYDRQIAADTAKLNAAEAKLNACKCPEPTRTAQVLPPATVPVVPAKPKVPADGKPNPVDVASALGLTTPTGTLDPHMYSVSLFGDDVFVGSGVTWEARADGTVVFTSADSYSDHQDIHTTVFKGNEDGSITYRRYTNGHQDTFRAGPELNSEDSLGFDVFFGGVPLASKPDTPVAVTVASITTSSGKGYARTDAEGGRVGVTSPDGSRIELYIFGSDYRLTIITPRGGYHDYYDIERGTIPPGTDLNQFINSKVDEAQSWQSSENKNLDTGHYDDAHAFGWKKRDVDPSKLPDIRKDLTPLNDTGEKTADPNDSKAVPNGKGKSDRIPKNDDTSSFNPIGSGPAGNVATTSVTMNAPSLPPMGGGSLLSINSSASGLVNVALSAPIALGVQNVVASGMGIQNASLAPLGRTTAAENRIEKRRISTHPGPPRLQLTALHESFLTFSSPLAVHRTIEEDSWTIDIPNQITYALVANGNSSGEALELQVLDPSGRIKQVEVPEGLVLEPLKMGAAQPLSARAPQGANLLTKQLTAYCVDYLKLPPQIGMLYRLAPQAVQDKFKPMASVLRAGRELAGKGQFHPDSDPKAYNDSIRQYSLWAKVENWGHEKFGEVFLEKTKQNAVSANVKWTKQMEQAVRGLVPGRWRDISMVLDEAAKLSSTSQTARPSNE